MEQSVLPALALPPFAHDALTVLSVGAAMLLGFVLINFGLLLPGLFAWLERSHADSRAKVVRHDGQRATEGKLIAGSNTSIAADKRSRSDSFIREAKMLRTSTTEVLRWVLRRRRGTSDSPTSAAAAPSAHS